MLIYSLYFNVLNNGGVEICFFVLFRASKAQTERGHLHWSQVSWMWRAGLESSSVTSPSDLSVSFRCKQIKSLHSDLKLVVTVSLSARHTQQKQAEQTNTELKTAGSKQWGGWGSYCEVMQAHAQPEKHTFTLNVAANYFKECRKVTAALLYNHVICKEFIITGRNFSIYQTLLLF